MGTLRIEFAGGTGDARALAARVASAAAATPGGDADGGRVVLVRRARVELAVRGAASEAAADAAGRALEEALRGALRRPQPPGEVRVFSSTAEYLAHFVEELAAGRTVDVWYFGPLLAFRGRGLGETLANLARAEAAAWPEVLRLLRRRGVFPGLMGRLSGAGREALRGVPPPPARPLGHDEGWPLFLAAWSAVSAALDRAGPSRTAQGAARPPSAAGALPASPGEAFRLYLETHPAAPAGWDDPASLGESVAAMVRWLLRRAAAPADARAGEAALARHPWIDPGPAARVFRERAAAPAAPGAPEERGSAEPSTSVACGAEAPLRAVRLGAMNRTRALRFLRAALLLVPPRASATADFSVTGAGGDSFLELEDEVWTVDDAAASLAAGGVAPSAEAVLDLLGRGDAGPGLPAVRAETASPDSAGDDPRTAAHLPASPAEKPSPVSGAGGAADGGAPHPHHPPAARAAAGGAGAPGAAADEAGRAPEGAAGGVPRRPQLPGGAGSHLSSGPLAVVAAAARHLDPGERRELAGALAARARARPLSLETAAVGVFFLVRPLVDLGVPGLAAREGLPPAALRALVHDAALRAAGAPPEDRAAEVVAWGGLGGEWAPDPPVSADDPRQAGLARALRAQAARLGLSLAEGEGGGEADVGALLLEAACRQLVRWLRGFEASSVAYVLGQLVRRPGAFRVPPAGSVEVVWPASGLDVVLERAGYLDPLASVPWWDGRGVRWER